jgi:hypothetical protein
VGTACRTLETAHSLGGLSDTAEAFRSGELSEVQASEIASAATADPNAEEQLLDAAARSSVKGLRDRCREVRAGAQADDTAWARRLHHERRAHDWTDADGAYRLDGRLPPDAGARFQSAWHAHIERIARHARAEGRHEPRAAYAADALVALATDGPCKPPEVRVVVDGSALARGHTRAGERCEIDGIGPAPVTTALALLDDARVTLMACDCADISAVSRPTRVIPAKLRRALEARYPVCAVKSCDNERRLEIDHVVPLAKGGRTELANLWRLCPHHHALKTHSAWAVVGSARCRDLVPPDRARTPDRPDPPRRAPRRRNSRRSPTVREGEGAQ